MLNVVDRCAMCVSIVYPEVNESNKQWVPGLVTEQA